MADTGRIEANFNDVTAFLEQQMAELKAQAAKAAEAADWSRVAEIEGRQAAIQGKTAEAAQASKKALEETGAQLERNIELNTRNLALLDEQVARAKALSEIAARAAAMPGLGMGAAGAGAEEQAAAYSQMASASSLRASAGVGAAAGGVGAAESAGEYAQIAYASRNWPNRPLRTPAEARSPIPPEFSLPASIPLSSGAVSGAEQAERRMQQQLAAQEAARARLKAQQDAAVAAAREQQRIQLAINDQLAKAAALGRQAAAQGTVMTEKQLAGAMQPPKGFEANWGPQQAQYAKLYAAQAQYNAWNLKNIGTTDEFTASLTRLGMVEAESSNAMRKHGAMTTEWLTALARGETTLGELSYQMGATIGKFAGWTVAAAATYGAFEAVRKFGEGATAAASGVQQLSRTIDGMGNAGTQQQAYKDIQDLSKGVNVSVSEASDAIFAYSRSFHNLADATAAAKAGLSVFKLDNVALTDSVKLSTSLTRQYGLSASDLSSVYDMISGGQREWNARISDVVPLLQRAMGTVKNAGGDLTQLVQLGIYAQSVTQRGGTQVGTAFYRSAATQLNPETKQGQTNIAYLQSQGIDTSKGWTQTLQNAILKASTLPETTRMQISLAMFGRQYGGQQSGIFAPTAAQTYQNIIGASGDPKKAITPTAQQGQLQVELNKQLDTAKERFKSIGNELERLGVAVGASGIITDLSSLVGVFVTIGGGVRSVIDAFDALPGPVRNVIEALAAFRALTLLTSRTRFGASIPGSRFLRLPGDQSYIEQSRRAELSRGTRQAITGVETDLARSTAQASQIERQKVVLSKERDLLKGQIDSSTQNANLKLQHSAIMKQIAELEKQENRVELERKANATTLDGLKKQLVGLSASKFSKPGTRSSTQEVQALAVDAGADLAAAEVNADLTAQSRFTRAKAKLRLLYAKDSAATSAAGKAAAGTAGAAGAAAQASQDATVEVEASTGRLAALAGRAGAFVAAIDPMMLALLGIPMVWGAVDSSIRKVSEATKEATDALQMPITDVDAWNKRIAALEHAAAAQRSAANSPLGIFGRLAHALSPKSVIQSVEAPPSAPSGPPPSGYPSASPTGDNPILKIAGSIVSRDAKFYGDLLGGLLGDGGARKTSAEAANEQVVMQSYQAMAATYTRDARALIGTKAGRLKLAEEAKRMVKTLNEVSAIESLPADAITQAQAALANAFSKSQEAARVAAAPKGGQDLAGILEGLSDAHLASSMQAFADRTDVYGASGNDLSKATQTALYMAARFRVSKDPTQLQQLKTAFGQITTAQNTTAKHLMDNITAATTQGGEDAATSTAISGIGQMRGNINRWVAFWEKRYKGNANMVRAIGEAGKYFQDNVTSLLQPAIQQQITDIQDSAALAAAQDQGLDPTDDIHRAEIVDNGLKQEIATARAAGLSWKVLEPMLTQLGNDSRSLAKSKIDNADSLYDSQQQLAVANITASGPAADMQRARLTLSQARDKLARDRAEHGHDQKRLNDDQRAIDEAYRGVQDLVQQQAQQTSQNAAALVSAQTALAQSETLDPVKQAREALAGDLKNLHGIKRSNYTTESEYLTAVANAKAQANKDRQAVNDASIQQDMNNLKYELDVQKIGDQQYVDGLKKILATKKMTQDQRHQILEEIYNIQNASATLDINAGSIKLPSVYEIRRAIGMGRRGTMPGAQNTVVNHTASVVVYVKDNAGAEAVGKVIDQHWHTTVQAAMRAKGVV